MQRAGHLVIGLIHCGVSLRDGLDDFEIIAAIYAETYSFSRSAAFSQLFQGKLPITFTINLIGRKPVKSRFEVSGNRPIRIEWKKQGYGWTSSWGIRGYDHLLYRTLVTVIVQDLKDLTTGILAQTFNVGADCVYIWRYFDQNARADVFRDWRLALTIGARSSLE